MKTVKVIFLVLFVSAIFYQSSAQRIFTGTITDNNSNSVSNAFVEIINASDTNLIYSDYTDDNGFYEISANIVGIKAGSPTTPNEFLELRNYPNPFNPSTIIYFNLPQPSLIQINIYDILGRKVKSLYKSDHAAGTGTVEWNSTNDKGVPVSAGIYFCRIETEQAVRVHKMLLLDGGSINYTNQNLNKSSEVNKLNHSNSESFLFNMRVSGETFATREIDSLICWQDTTIDAQLNKIVSSTIGISGGKIKTDGFELTIPPDAFDSEYTISVHQDYDGNPFGEYGNSEEYILSGLPVLDLISLKLRMKYQNPLISEVYFTVSSDRYFPELEKDINYYQFFNCMDSSSYVIGEINLFMKNPFTVLKKSNEIQSDKTRKISVLNNYSKKSVRQNVTLYTDKNQNEELELIINSAFEKFDNLGFDKLNQYFFKAEFMQVYYDVNVLKHYVIPFGVNQTMKPDGDGSFIDDGEELLILVVDNPYSQRHLFSFDMYSSVFASIQGKYSFVKYIQNPWSSNPDRNKNLWLHQAINSWAGTISGIYPPFRFFLNIDAPISPKGLTPNEEDFKWHSNYGNGLSSLIFYLDDLNLSNSNHIANIYKYLYQNNPSCHIKALITSIQDSLNLSVNQWYPDFINKYLLGQVFEFNTSDILKYFEKQWDIDSKNDTMHVFNEDSEINYPDISTKIFQINCNFQDINPDDELHIQTISTDVSTDYRKLFVYEHSANHFALLAESDGSTIGLTNIKPLFDEQKSLYCVVVNSLYSEPNFYGESEINLRVEVKKKSESEMDFDRCGLAINYGYGAWKRVWNETTYIDAVNINMQAKGSFTDESTFEGSWTDYTFFESESPRTGNCKVIIDPITKEILSFEFYQVTDHYVTFYENYLYKEISIKGGKKSLPVTYQNEYQLNYSAPNGSSLDYFNANDLAIKEVRYDVDPVVYSKEYQLINYSDISNTEFQITFYYE